MYISHFLNYLKVIWSYHNSVITTFCSQRKKPPKLSPLIRSAYTSDQRYEVSLTSEEMNSETSLLHTNTVSGPPKLPPRAPMNFIEVLESNSTKKLEVCVLYYNTWVIQEHDCIEHNAEGTPNVHVESLPEVGLTDFKLCRDKNNNRNLLVLKLRMYKYSGYCFTTLRRLLVANM